MRYKFGLDMDISFGRNSGVFFIRPDERLLTIVLGRIGRGLRWLSIKGRFNGLPAGRAGRQGAFAVSAGTTSGSETGSEALALTRLIFPPV
jgi:hypothetical protein